eukprot:2734799-Amphidinium_carterae.1
MTLLLLVSPPLTGVGPTECGQTWHEMQPAKDLCAAGRGTYKVSVQHSTLMAADVGAGPRMKMDSMGSTTSSRLMPSRRTARHRRSGIFSV